MGQLVLHAKIMFYARLVRRDFLSVRQNAFNVNPISLLAMMNARTAALIVSTAQAHNNAMFVLQMLTSRLMAPAPAKLVTTLMQSRPPASSAILHAKHAVAPTNVTLAQQVKPLEPQSA